MINFKNIDSATCTSRENLVFLTAYNKAFIYDLNTKSVIAEFKIPNVGGFYHIAFENYMTIYADDPCILDLDSMKIIHKWSLNYFYRLVENQLLREEYKEKVNNKSSIAKGFSLEIYGGYIADINRERLTMLVSYGVFGYDNCVKYVDLAEIEMGTWKYIGYKNDSIDTLEHKFICKQNKYPFLCYDDETLEKLLGQLNIGPYSNWKDDDWPLVLYYPKYKVLFKGGFMYELDGLDKAGEDELPPDDEFNQKGFDSEKYLRENGVTDKALKYLSPEIVMEGGYLWALDSLEKKAKELNLSSKIGDFFNASYATEEEYIFHNVGLFDLMVTDDGFGEFVEEGDEEEFNELIKVLNLIGAMQAVKIVKKCIAKSENNKGDKNKFDEIVALADEIEDDYIGLAIDYIKKKRGILG